MVEIFIDVLIELYKAGILQAAFVIGAIAVIIGIIGKFPTIEITPRRCIILIVFGTVLMCFGVTGFVLVTISGRPPQPTSVALLTPTASPSPTRPAPISTNTPPAAHTPSPTVIDTSTPTFIATNTNTPTPTDTPTPTTIPPTATPIPPAVEGRIAFYSNRDGNDEIYVMNTDGTGQIRLTNNPASERMPSWSSDGERIAFESNRDGNDEIYVMNIDSTSQTRLTNNPTNDWAPVWSPDSQCIAFISDRYGDLEIYVMNTDGSGMTYLTDNHADDWLPSWSPDGTRIVFQSDRDGNHEIYVMNADGSEQTRLTNSPGWDEAPSWSPDGTRIAFVSNRDDNHEIYVMNADGSGQTRLTNNPAYDRFPSWSPDGGRIAFESDRDGNYEIYVMNADGSSQTNLTNNPADDRGAAILTLTNILALTGTPTDTPMPIQVLTPTATRLGSRLQKLDSSDPDGCKVSDYDSDWMWLSSAHPVTIKINLTPIGQFPYNPPYLAGTLFEQKVNKGDTICVEGEPRDFGLFWGPDVKEHYITYCDRGFCPEVQVLNSYDETECTTSVFPSTQMWIATTHSAIIRINGQPIRTVETTDALGVLFNQEVAIGDIVCVTTSPRDFGLLWGPDVFEVYQRFRDSL